VFNRRPFTEFYNHLIRWCKT